MKNIIMRILHLIPFMHFYGKWEFYRESKSYITQIRYCHICNKVKTRIE